MICPGCQHDVEALFLTDRGQLCRDCKKYGTWDREKFMRLYVTRVRLIRCLRPKFTRDEVLGGVIHALELDGDYGDAGGFEALKSFVKDRFDEAWQRSEQPQTNN